MNYLDRDRSNFKHNKISAENCIWLNFRSRVATLIIKVKITKKDKHGTATG